MLKRRGIQMKRTAGIKQADLITTYAQGTFDGVGMPFSTAELQKNPVALAGVFQAAGYGAIWALHQGF